jgi:hypothetical protein
MVGVQEILNMVKPINKKTALIIYLPLSNVLVGDQKSPLSKNNSRGLLKHSFPSLATT